MEGGMIAFVAAAALAIASPAPIIPAPTYTPQAAPTRAPSCPPTTAGGIIVPDDDLVPAVVRHTTCKSKAVQLAVADPAPAAPCAHRVACGPIHLLPKSPAERRAFLIRVAFQAFDGIVTSAGLRASQRTRFANIDALVPCKNPSFATPCSQVGALPDRAPDVSSAWPAWEVDPLVVPFAHGGLPTLIAGGIVADLGGSIIERHWSASAREAVDVQMAATHAAGASTWFPILARIRSADAQYAACQQAAAHGFIIGAPSGSATAPPEGISLVKYVPGLVGAAIQPYPACRPYSDLPVFLTTLVEAS
jgi:hypothetical protein